MLVSDKGAHPWLSAPVFRSDPCTGDRLRRSTSPPPPPRRPLKRTSFPVFPLVPVVRRRDVQLHQERTLLAFQPLLVMPDYANPVGATMCLTTDRIVSWLTPKSAASDRKLLVPARARMEHSCSNVSLRARARYRGRVETSPRGCRRGGHRTSRADPARRSGKGMRAVPIVIEDAEPIPFEPAISDLTISPDFTFRLDPS